MKCELNVEVAGGVWEGKAIMKWQVFPGCRDVPLGLFRFPFVLMWSFLLGIFSWACFLSLIAIPSLELGSGSSAPGRPGTLWA